MATRFESIFLSKLPCLATTLEREYLETFDFYAGLLQRYKSSLDFSRLGGRENSRDRVRNLVTSKLTQQRLVWTSFILSIFGQKYVWMKAKVVVVVIFLVDVVVVCFSFVQRIFSLMWSRLLSE